LIFVRFNDLSPRKAPSTSTAGVLSQVTVLDLSFS
jgi:hypothetical protein